MQDKSKEVSTVPNPFADTGKELETPAGAMLSNQAMAAVQGAVVMAKQFPRDQGAAMNRILDTCTRVSLAREAEYAFPRGGDTVSGPSIRLAEVLATNWGNVDFGIIELGQEAGFSQVMAYCWDLETNTRAQKVFVAAHVRDKRGGGKTILTTGRDIYEHTTNMGARRLRACILAIIPKDVIDAAVEQCRLTLSAEIEDPKAEAVKLVAAFKEFGVTEAHLKARLGRKLDTITAGEIVRFRAIYRSLKDEMSGPETWFDMKAKSNGSGKAATSLKDKLKTEPHAGDLGEGESQILDSKGTAFDTELHAVDKQSGAIVFNKDGTFRKRPRKAAAEPEDPGGDPDDPGHTGDLL